VLLVARYDYYASGLRQFQSRVAATVGDLNLELTINAEGVGYRLTNFANSFRVTGTESLMVHDSEDLHESKRARLEPEAQRSKTKDKPGKCHPQNPFPEPSQLRNS
jgi:hypothetical protein